MVNKLTIHSGERKACLEDSNRNRNPDSEKGKPMRSRSYAERTPDGKYRCIECGQIFSTLQDTDAHHLRINEQ